MKHTRTIVATLAALGLALTVSACGDGTTKTDAGTERTASNGDVFDDADVAFATAMIPHHAQALTMVDLTRGRPLTPPVQALTEQIRDAQAPEIEEMVDWLTAWDEPVPATSRDHVHGDESAGGMDMDGSDGPHGSDGSDGMGGMDGMDGTDGTDDTEGDDTAMPGMMSSADLARLDSAPDDAFEDMWLQMMIEHHEGAIAMAKDEQAHGAFGPALDLADSIVSSQQAEIDRMQHLLDR